MKRQFIEPSVLGGLLLLCLLLVLATSMRGVSVSTVAPPSIDEPGAVGISRTYGIPRMLQIDTHGPTEDQQGPPTVRIHWGTIAAVLVVGWCVAMPIGRWITGYVRRDGAFAGPRHTGWSHPAAIIGYVLAGCAVVGTIGGIVFERTIGAGESMAELLFGCFMLLMVLAVPITVIVLIVLRWGQRSRLAQRGFPIDPWAGRLTSD